MSDSDKTLLAAVAMRAKKNAIAQGGQEATVVSITAKVKALSEAGFSDGEIDKILAVEGTTAHPTKPRFEVNGDVPLETIKTIMREEGFSKAEITQELSKAQYNQQVDETLQFTKINTVIIVVMVIGIFISVLLPISPTDGFWPSFLWVAMCLSILFIRTIPFAFKKADYFLKR